MKKISDNSDIDEAGTICTYFSGISSGLLKKEDFLYLDQIIEMNFFAAGECLWHEGDLESPMGLVFRGRVKLLKETENPHHPILLGLFGPGTLVFDPVFMEELPSETSACALENTWIICLPSQQLLKILTERPALGCSLFRKTLGSAGEQLRQAYRRLTVFF